MDLSYINHSLYPRAVNASAKGRLRHGETEQEFATYSTSRTPDTAATEHQQRPSSSRSSQSRQRQGEQQAGRPGRNPHSDQAMAGNMGFGEQMAVATRQARQAHVRRGYTVPALVSARGREANRRYLETSMSNQHRFIDEMV